MIDNAWSGTPDVKSSTFPTLSIGHNAGASQADSDYEYLRIYSWDGVKPTITSSEDVDDYFKDEHLLTTILNPIEESFYHLAVGTGTKPFFNINNQSLMTDLDLHISFEDKDTTTFRDNYNNFEANIYGTFIIANGISGKTIEWNGIDTEAEVVGMTLDDDDREWNFWITPGTVNDADPSMAYISGYLNIFYNTSTNSIDATVTGGSGSATASYAMSLVTFEAGEFMISVSFTQGATLKLFIDGVEQNSVSVASIGTFTSTGDLFIGSADGSNYYVGKIDEFRIYSKILNSADRLELFNRKLGTLNYLANEVYRKQISSNQIVGHVDWEVGVGTIPANSINEEIIEIGDDSTYIFNGTLNHINLSPGYLDFSYYSFPNYHTATANKKGEIIGTNASGSINFETGVYELITRRSYLIGKEQISASELTIIDYTSTNPNIVPGECTLYYIMGSTLIDVTDDGIGAFTHATISSGTINYITGKIDITFTSETDVGEEIYIVYNYYKWSIPTLDTNITVEYKLLDNLEITEVALLNDDSIATVYANIPKTEYASIVNHTGFQFFVEQ